MEILKKIDCFLASPLPLPKNSDGIWGWVFIAVGIIFAITVKYHQNFLLFVIPFYLGFLMMAPYGFLGMLLVPMPIMVATNENVISKIELVVPGEVFAVISLILGFLICSRSKLVRKELLKRKET